MESRESEQDIVSRIRGLWKILLVPIAIVIACAVLVRGGLIESEQERVLAGLALLLAGMLLLAVFMAYMILRTRLTAHRLSNKHGAGLPQ